VYAWFATSYRLPVPAAVVALAVLVTWMAYLGMLTRRLWHGFDKPAARMTHVGSILVFTAVNLITSLGVLLA
jgi:purine-cytosine permease-like protein